MKTFKIQNCLVVTMLLFTTMVAHAQEHQTYSCPFGHNNAGTVTYSYYIGDDGQRMFDGKYRSSGVSLGR